jgi:SAM-dependent methyltransferase
MTPTGSAELRDVYEAQYDASGKDARRAGEWRALCAQNKADHVAELAARLPEPPRTVAEVGCGDGVLLSALEARGVGEVRHGFEISERAVALAAGRPEIDRVERFDGITLPAPDDAYDLGVLSHVLEHVPEPGPLLRETARVARAVVVEVPLEDNRSASRSSARRGREQVGHLHRFSREDVHALATAAGLAVAAELADPLPRAVHTFHARGAAGRAKAEVKAVLRRTLFAAAPGAAERAFTVHHACLLVPLPA